MPNRIEREIEEILTKLDKFVPEERRSRKMRRNAGSAFARVRLRLRSLMPGITGGHVVLAAALMLIASIFVKSVAPTVAFWMTIIGLIIIFGAIILSIRGPRRGLSSPQNYWRGQPVELRRPGLLMRLRMWWRRRNTGR